MDKELIKKYILPVFDMGFVFISFILALLIRVDFNTTLLRGTYNVAGETLIVIIAIHFIFYSMLKIQYTVWHKTSVSEFMNILIMNLASALILSLLRLTFILPGLRFSIIFTMLILNIILMFSARIMYRYIRLNIIQSERKDKGERVLIYGAGSAGKLIVQELLENDIYDYNLIGMLDDNVQLHGSRFLTVPVLGGIETAQDIIHKHKIQTVILAMPSESNETRQHILNQLTKLNVDVKLVSSSSSLMEADNLNQSLREVKITDLLGRPEIVIQDEEISDMLKGKVVLVTGAGGSIGSELVRQIVAKSPKEIILMDVNETGLYNLEQELKISKREGKLPYVKISTLIKSIRDYNSLDALMDEYRPNYVYHAAAHKHVPLMETVPEEAIKNNIIGTYYLIKLARKYEVEKFINISTDKAVNPTNIMGATKRYIEMMIQAYNTDKTKFVAVRFGNVLGSNGSVVPLFEKQIAKGGPITLTHPEITRYFMTIPEAVSLVLQAGVYADGGEIFVLDMGDEVKIKDLAVKMIELSGLTPHKDIKIEYIGLRPGEKLYEELLVDMSQMNKTPNDLIFVEAPANFETDIIEKQIESLKEVVYETDYDFKSVMKSIVPTYTPDN